MAFAKACQAATRTHAVPPSLQDPTYYYDTRTDVGACISCVELFGDSLAPACVNCAQATNVARCMSCLQAARPNFCAAQGRPDDVMVAKTCAPEVYQACRGCADRAMDYGR